MAIPDGNPAIQPMFLDGVLNAVRSTPRLTARQSREIVSALRVLSKLTGQPLEAVPAEVPFVRKLLGEVRPARHDISHKRWANIRSLIFKGLDIAGIPRRPGRSRVKLTPIWDQYLRPLPYRPYRVALMPFARFCTAKGVEPTQVCEPTFAAFERELEGLSGRARPRETYRAACCTWNAARRQFPHWLSLAEAKIEDRRQDYALPWSAFPASLKADVDAMEQALVDPDPLSPEVRRPLRATTVRTRVWRCKAFASALVRAGYQPETVTSLACLVEPKAARDGLRFLWQRGGKRKSAHVRDFARLLLILARHWVQRPDHALAVADQKAQAEQLAQLRALCKNLEPARDAMTEKNRSTLRHFRDEHVADKLVGLPHKIWRQYPSAEGLNRSDLVKLQVALAIEILTVAPIRLKNLVEIRNDHNLVWSGSGSRRRVGLYLPAEEVKNGEAIEFELPDSTRDLLDAYLSDVKPRLAGASAWLFPGESNSHKRDYLLSKQIADLTKFEIGVRLTAHQFRHIAGFLYLKAHPTNFEVVRRLLGHRSTETTMRFYAQMERLEAGRHYGNIIAQRRAALGPSGRRKLRTEARSHGL